MDKKGAKGKSFGDRTEARGLSDMANMDAGQSWSPKMVQSSIENGLEGSMRGGGKKDSRKRL